MGNSNQKTIVNKDEVIHDLNNLNYILRALAKLINGVPALPSEIKRLSIGAITTTDKIISKLRGNTKAQIQQEIINEQTPAKNEEESSI